MKSVSLRQAQTRWMNALKDKKLLQLDLYPFKKDRSLSLIRTPEGFFLKEAGFIHQEILLKENSAKKILKEAFVREFPRSNRIYISEKFE